MLGRFLLIIFINGIVDISDLAKFVLFADDPHFSARADDSCEWANDSSERAGDFRDNRKDYGGFLWKHVRLNPKFVLQ